MNRHPTRDCVRNGPVLWVALCIWLTMCSTASAFTQHLVGAGDAWSDIDRDVRPGDEIILMPGEHRPGLLDHLHGTPEEPITIRGIDPRRPPVIKAERYGLRLRNATYINIHNIVIEDASVAGLHITSEPAFKRTPVVDECQSISIRDVTILRTGTDGVRHALWLIDLQDVSIENVTIEGWTGAGMEIHGCRRVHVSNCCLAGRDAFKERFGLRLRGGTSHAWIKDCVFEGAGEIALAIGWPTPVNDYFPPVETAPSGRILERDKRFEVDMVQVRNCIVRRSACTAAFKHAGTVQFRNNTIYRPRLTVFAVDAPHDDPRIADNKKVVIGNNLIVWQPGDIKHFALFGTNARPEGIQLERNLWWSEQLSERLEELGPMPGETPGAQVTDVDPQLDEELVPRNNSASLFGAGSR